MSVAAPPADGLHHFPRNPLFKLSLHCLLTHNKRDAYLHNPALGKRTSATGDYASFRHNEGSIKILPQNPQYYSALMVRGVSGGPYLGLHDAKKR